MSEAEKVIVRRSKPKKGLFSRMVGGILDFARDHTKSAFMGAILGTSFFVGLSVGFVAAVTFGAPLATALIVSGGAAILTGLAVDRCLVIPPKKLTFYASTLLTVAGMSGAFNSVSYKQVAIPRLFPDKQMMQQFEVKPKVRINSEYIEFFDKKGSSVRRMDLRKI